MLGQAMMIKPLTVESVPAAISLLRVIGGRSYAIMPTTKASANDLKTLVLEHEIDDIDFRSYEHTRFGDVIVLFGAGALSDREICSLVGVFNLN